MITRGKKLKKETERMKLGPEGIDRAAGFMEETLSLAGVERKDILRLRLAAEDLLMMWNSRLPEDTELVFRCGTRLGKPYLHLCARGSRIDPAQTEEESGWIYSELLARAGLSLEASYRDGENRLSVYPPKVNRFGALSQIFLAIALAVLAGAVCRTLPQGVRSGISSFVDPLFTAMMGILQTLAGPMVFLSVCRGIINIGDVGMLGKIGRTIVLRFLAAVYIITAVTALAVTWFFHPGTPNIYAPYCAAIVSLRFLIKHPPCAIWRHGDIFPSQGFPRKKIRIYSRFVCPRCLFFLREVE